MRKRPMLPEEQLESNLRKLPKACYATLPQDPRQVILLKRGDLGYWKVGDSPMPDKQQALDFVTEYNAKLEVTARQVNAMLHGSLFGFQTPSADPDHDINKA